MRKKSQPSYYVPALEKGLDVLEALAVAAVPQTLADLARTLDRTSSELFRMIDALEKRAYIVRDPVSGAYRLTLKLFELAHTHSPVDHLLRAASLPMRDLAEEIHESVHISIFDRGMLLLIDQAESPERVRLSVEVGSQVPALETVSGRLLVAYLDEDERERFLTADPAYAKMPLSLRESLEAELRHIPQEGYHMAQSIARIGVDISVLVGNPRVGVSAVLGVPFLAGGRNEGREKSLVPLMQKCAARITASLGLSRVE